MQFRQHPLSIHLFRQPLPLYSRQSFTITWHPNFDALVDLRLTSLKILHLSWIKSEISHSTMINRKIELNTRSHVIFTRNPSRARLDKISKNRRQNYWCIFEYSAVSGVSKMNLTRCEIYRIIQLPRARSVWDDEFLGNLKLYSRIWKNLE